MLQFFVKRLMALVLTLVVASGVIFLCLEIVPGDPALYMLGLNAQEDTLAALRAELGLDMGPVARYWAWVSGMMVGDFGISYTYRTPVAEMVAERLKVSLPLAIYALTLSTAIAFPAGIWAASRRGRGADIAVMGVTQLGVAIPNFWFAMLMVLVFAIHLRWFNAGGFAGWEAGLGPVLKSLTLPAIALALPQASILARVMRSALLDSLNEDYVRTARAKGLGEAVVVMVHVLRNSMIPVITIIALGVPSIFGGAIITEVVFSVNGIGSQLINALFANDLPLVMTVTFIFAMLIVLFNIIADVLYGVLDPRIRYD